MDLPEIWFGVIVAAWVLFFVLEGFDFGVAMIAGLAGRPACERDAAVRTIAPTWDGNEVWLVGAIGLMFAVFPDWYSAVLAGLYLPMVVILLALAARGVALEFRGKYHGEGEERWRRRCDLVMAWSSLITVGLWGAVLAVLARGLRIDAAGEVVGGGWSRSIDPLLTWQAGLGAVAGVMIALLLGAGFLALRTTGGLRVWARTTVVRSAAALTVGALLVAGVTGTPVIAAIALPAALAAVAGRLGREALAFVGGGLTVAVATVAALAGHAPTLLTSTLDPAWSVTVDSAVTSTFSLNLITWAAVCILPAVVIYQVFSYWVFRQRISSDRVVGA